MNSDKLTKLVDDYADLSFKVNKMGEEITSHELGDVLTLEQDAVLRYIREHQPCTSSALSKAFYVEKSAITAIINRLVTKGFIDRIRSKEDRRVIYLQLTEHGNQFHKENRERVNRIFGNIISKFDANEIEAFMRTYEKLASLLEKQLTELKGVNE